MEKYVDFVPSKEADLANWLLNLILRIIENATLLGWDNIEPNVQRNFTIPPGQKVNVLIGRFPDGMGLRFLNQSMASVRVSLSDEPREMSSMPIPLPSAMVVNTTVNALGGLGKYFLNIQNTSPTESATVSVFLPRAGWVIASCSNVLYKLGKVIQLKDDLQNAIDDKDTTKAEELSFLREEIRDIKTNPNITPGILIDMEIEPQHASVNTDVAPVAKVSKVPTGYKLSFNRKGAFKGVNIYRQRPGAEKALVKVLLKPSWIDTQPMVNNTVYSFYYLDKDGEEIGEEGNYTVRL